MGIKIAHKLTICFLIFCFVFLFTACDELITEGDTENKTNETIDESIPSQTEKNGEMGTVDAEASLLPKPGFYLSSDKTVLPADATFFSFTMTARDEGVSLHWANQWKLYQIEGKQKKLIGGIAEEAGIERPIMDGEIRVVYNTFISFNELAKESTLPAGEYELVYMMGGKLSSESIRFTIQK